MQINREELRQVLSELTDSVNEFPEEGLECTSIDQTVKVGDKYFMFVLVESDEDGFNRVGD
jgi:hypothetical protein